MSAKKEREGEKGLRFVEAKEETTRIFSFFYFLMFDLRLHAIELPSRTIP